MMGLAVGAEMDSLPQPVMNFSNATPSTFVEKRVYFPGAMNWGIMVTEEGKRFTNENNPRQYAGNAMNLQIRSRAHLLLHLRSGDDPKLAGQGRRGGRRTARSR